MQNRIYYEQQLLMLRKRAGLSHGKRIEIEIKTMTDFALILEINNFLSYFDCEPFGEEEINRLLNVQSKVA